jgi:hypothetical protein
VAEQAGMPGPTVPSARADTQFKGRAGLVHWSAPADEKSIVQNSEHCKNHAPKHININ